MRRPVRQKSDVYVARVLGTHDTQYPFASTGRVNNMISTTTPWYYGNYLVPRTTQAVSKAQGPIDLCINVSPERPCLHFGRVVDTPAHNIFLLSLGDFVQPVERKASSKKKKKNNSLPKNTTIIVCALNKQWYTGSGWYTVTVRVATQGKTLLRNLIKKKKHTHTHTQHLRRFQVLGRCFQVLLPSLRHALGLRELPLDCGRRLRQLRGKPVPLRL